MAGYSSTINRAGKIMNTSGKSIFTGACWTFSCAFWRRRLRVSDARFRIIVPIDTPNPMGIFHAKIVRRSD